MSTVNNDKYNEIIRVGSRKSELALIQTRYVIKRLQQLNPDINFVEYTMTTVGDRVLNKSLPKIGEKSLFTKDLEDALRNNGVDFVVHSLKDLPTTLPNGMAIGAVLQREDPRDALVLNQKFNGKCLKTLPEGSIIGTSSLRRSSQLAKKYPKLRVCDIRGNLNTRLAKLDDEHSKFAGIVLATAGLERMGWNNRISQIIEPDDILYAVGQGALAVECRSNDYKILEMLSKLSHIETQCRIVAERSFLKKLEGGCSAPVAVCTDIITQENNNVCLQITGAVYSLKGDKEIKKKQICKLKNFNEKFIEISNKRGNEDDDENIISNKRAKIDDELNRKNNNNIMTPTNNSDNTSSPSCSKIGAGDYKNLDFEAFINIHGEPFKKCPYSIQHQQDKLKKNDDCKKSEDSVDVAGCPLHIPIGQDFMGLCPYFDTKQKVELETNKPFHSLINEQQQNNSIIITENIITSSDTNQNKTSKCPFKIVDTEKCPFKLADIEKTFTTDAIDKCPFLKEAKVQTELNEINNENIIDDDDTETFCGLFKHKTYKCNLLKICEELGEDLANNLINAGALDIIKAAQQEIRGEKS